jgi:hypothetical protein
MTAFLLSSVVVLLVALAGMIISLLRAKDGYEDRAGFHPVRHAGPRRPPAVGRIANRIPTPSSRVARLS